MEQGTAEPRVTLWPSPAVTHLARTLQPSGVGQSEKEKVFNTP